jgi:uncharacterized protein (DUF1330 family)
MSAYVIGSYDIADAKGYEGYVPGVVPLLQKHGAEIIVASYDAQALEGERRDVYVVLKFASEEAALAWYNDPDYAAVKKIRLGSCTNANLALAKHFVMPTG